MLEFIEKYKLLLDNNRDLVNIKNVNDIEEVLNYLKKKTSKLRRSAMADIKKKDKIMNNFEEILKENTELIAKISKGSYILDNDYSTELYNKLHDEYVKLIEPLLDTRLNLIDSISSCNFVNNYNDRYADRIDCIRLNMQIIKAYQEQFAIEFNKNNEPIIFKNNR